VPHLKVGMRVGCMVQLGGFATEVVAHMNTVYPIGDMPFDVAAGMALVYGTSYHALKQRAQLRPGEKMLVLGAAGGVGLAAVELGKVMGADVIAAASTAKKLAVCKEYGAAHGINYTTEDLKARAKELSGGGVDEIGRCSRRILGHMDGPRAKSAPRKYGRVTSMGERRQNQPARLQPS